MDELLNIYVCMIAPLLLMFFLLKGDSKYLNLFLIVGMSVCLAAGYINNFVIAKTGYSQVQSTYYVTPICEELLKMLPVLCFARIKKPSAELLISSALAVGIGFATLENVYYITVFGADHLLFLLMRGFATGIMHGLCTAIVGYGFAYIYQQKRIIMTGTFALLCGAITYHAIYNLLISFDGLAKCIGIVMPITSAVICLSCQKTNQLMEGKPNSEKSRNH